MCVVFLFSATLMYRKTAKPPKSREHSRWFQQTTRKKFLAVTKSAQQRGKKKDTARNEREVKEWEEKKKKVNLFHGTCEMQSKSRCCCRRAGGINSADLCDNLCICEVVFAPKWSCTMEVSVGREKSASSMRGACESRGKSNMWSNAGDFVDFSSLSLARCCTAKSNGSISLRIQLFLNWKLNFYWKIVHSTGSRVDKNIQRTKDFYNDLSKIIWISIELCTFLDFDFY